MALVYLTRSTEYVWEEKTAIWLIFCQSAGGTDVYLAFLCKGII